MCLSSPPDMLDAAQKTSDSSQQKVNQQTAANRPNQITPWGSTTWNGDTQTQNLAPGAQSLLNNAEQNFNQGIDYSALPAAPDAEGARTQAINATENQFDSRLDPQWNQREEQQKTQLMNQGLDPNSEAYKNAMGQFSRDRNDAYQTAHNNAIQSGAAAAQQMWGMGMGNRQQALSEATQKMMTPLQGFQGIMSTNLNMPTFQRAGQAMPVDLTDAWKNQYGMNEQSSSDLMTGMADVGKTAAMFGFM